jgi:dTDP-4-amino-4,6-dideoxygalactose transaminase
MKWRVPLSDVDLGDAEKKAVIQVIENGWLAMGEITEAFETEFAQAIGSKHAIAVTNGTASLHLACSAIGLKPGDEVIVPSLTFVATANAILYTGATPVFADITSENDLTISPEAIEQKITPHTKAIMVMHYAGYGCDMSAISALAARHHLAIIEDAAHAPGAEIANRALGKWGEIASFSFFPNKNMTTAEGGMLVTDNDQLAKTMRMLRSHGMTTLTWDRHQGHAWSYDVVALGYNYRIDEIRSALGREQLKKLNLHNQRRAALTLYYREQVRRRGIEVSIPFDHHPGNPSCHILPVLLPAGIHRTDFAQKMKAAAIQTSLHYPPIHLFQYYQSNQAISTAALPLTEAVALREVTLPLYPTMQEEDIDYVLDSMEEALKTTRVLAGEKNNKER